MVNLGICLKCPQCEKLMPALKDDKGRIACSSHVVCGMRSEYLGWDSVVPEGCLFGMEHLLSRDNVEDLAEEAEDLKVRVA